MTVPNRLTVHVLQLPVSSGIGVAVQTGYRLALVRGGYDPRFAEHYPEDYSELESLFRCTRNKLRVGELPATMFDRGSTIPCEVPGFINTE